MDPSECLGRIIGWASTTILIIGGIFAAGLYLYFEITD